MRRTERHLLTALAVFTLSAIGGYGYYALHPENLPPTDLALKFYSISFEFFAQLHILVAFGTLATLLVMRSGARWVPALVIVYALSFTSEHIGTGYGIPFGGYSYTGLLGSRLGPRVPLLIPLSWFLMAMPSWVIARYAFPQRRLQRYALGGLGLVLWDLALDPAMSFLTPYWRWEEAGPYYGMPFANLFGWFITGATLMVAIDWADRSGKLAELPVRWMGVYYGLVLLLPLGMLGAAGEWPAVATTLTACITVGLIVRATPGGNTGHLAAEPVLAHHVELDVPQAHGG
jgi:putative membrane protein